MEEEKIYDMTDGTVESRYVQELKDRSYVNCLTTAYHNVVDNFKSLFDQVWKLALVYAVIFGITMAVRYTTLSVDKPFDMLLNLLTSAATVVAGIVYVGKIFEFLNGHDFKYNHRSRLLRHCHCLLHGRHDRSDFLGFRDKKSDGDLCRHLGGRSCMGSVLNRLVHTSLLFWNQVHDGRQRPLNPCIGQGLEKRIQAFRFHLCDAFPGIHCHRCHQSLDFLTFNRDCCRLP